MIKWSKFSGARWLKDGSGFFYSRYAAPADGQAFSGVNKNQQVYFHELGTPQERDALVYRARRSAGLGLQRGRDRGRPLSAIVAVAKAPNRENRIFVQRPRRRPDRRSARSSTSSTRATTSSATTARRFYVLTDNAADAVSARRDRPGERRSLRRGRRSSPSRAGATCSPGSTMVGDRFVVQLRTDAHERWSRLTHGRHARARDRAARARDRSAAFSASGATPRRSTRSRRSRIRRPSIATIPRPAQSTRLQAARSVTFDPADYETTQVFYASKDGTKIPMFLVGTEGARARRHRRRRMLYGYGGFNISLTPAFSPALIGWLEMGGVYAQPNLRGGGEYGKAWHDAGRLDAQAERVRRLHRGGRVPDPRAVHVDAEAGDQRRQQRRPARRRVP